MLGIQIFILVVLLMFSGFFSGVETALMSISNIKVKALMRQGKRGSIALNKIKQQPKRLIITILIGNNIVNIGAASLATVIFTGLYGSKGVGIATGVMTFLVLIFGEITPKTFATQNAEKISLIVARPISILMKILAPLVIFFRYISNFIAKLLGSKSDNKLSVDEIKTTLMMGGEEGIISRDAAEIMHNVIEFDKTVVTKVMTPKVDMVALDGNQTIKKATDFFVRNKFSRYPVYETNEDNVIGILDVDDLLKSISAGKNDVRIKTIVNEIIYVPESKQIDDLLVDFEGKETPMAIVVDEYGVVVGMVTIEDILEEIVGEIFDKNRKDSLYIKKINDRMVKADAKAPIEEIDKMFGLGLKEKQFNTLAGYITHRLQRIPEKGERIKLKNITIEVENVTRKGIKSAKIIRH